MVRRSAAHPAAAHRATGGTAGSPRETPATSARSASGQSVPEEGPTTASASTPGQRLLDLVQMLTAMLGAPQVDRAAGGRVLREQFLRQGRDRLVDRARGLDGERGGSARRQRELRRLRGGVDPLDVDRVLRRNLRAALQEL